MSEALQKQLHDLAQTIRGKQDIPQSHPLSVYQDLVHNNLNAVVSPCFPILQTILSDAQWHALIDDFLANYSATYPQCHRISEHFVDFLAHHQSLPYPFLADLAYYEWLELAVDLSENPSQPASLSEDIGEINFELSSSAKMHLFHYPVHEIHAACLPESEEPTALVVYREKPNGSIEFMKINLLSYHLLHFLLEEEYTLKAYLAAVFEAQKAQVPDETIEQYKEFLHTMLQQSIIKPKSL